MQHDAYSVEILTADQAREFVRANDGPELRACIARFRNVDEVDVDQNGDVWVGNPQPHWLRDVELVETMEAIRRGV